jgi:hypothetical protein
MLLVVFVRLHIFGKLYPEVWVLFVFVFCESFALYFAQNGAVRRPKSAFQLFLHAGSRTDRERVSRIDVNMIIVNVS